MTESSETLADGWLSREIAAMASARRSGVAASAREIIAAHPGLDDESALRLIYEETLIRREAGEDADTAEVLARYPQWAAELRDLFDCDKLMRDGVPRADFPEAGETLGPFLLLAELGRGGSGRTFLANDPSLADRPVVVKVISDDQDEHLALARLRHTHIVPLFSEHAFPDRGLRVLCMPDLGGADLARVLDDLDESPPSRRSGRLLVEIIDRHSRVGESSPPADGPFRRGLEGSTYVRSMTWIASCLADALHYAHARGLVHMDVKPSNVLITADGQPMLLDFHLARGPIAAGESVAGRLGGTPGWMSPEQESAMTAVSAGDPAPTGVDGRSDLFSLGLLLRKALGDDPDAGTGLRDIVDRCTQPDPEVRYRDASSLADDLRRHLADLPMRGVRNRSPRERWRKWRRRHPGALPWGVAVATIFSSLVAVGMIASIAHRQKVAQVRAASEEGRDDLDRGKFSEAETALRRGLVAIPAWPGWSGWRSSLEHDLERAERGRAIERFHEVADLVRFRSGIEPPTDDEAASLSRICLAVWNLRDRLAPRPGDDPVAALQIRDDLIEIAAIGAELRSRDRVGRTDPNPRADAVRMIDEALALAGPSFVLDDLRSRLSGEPVASVASRHRPARTPWEHYDRGRSLLRSGRWAEAAVEFGETLRSRPQDFWSNFSQGTCFYRLKSYADSAAAFRSCCALAPRSATCRYDRALALDALGRLAEARDEYSSALELDPRLVPSRLNRGIVSYKLGRHEEAIDDLTITLKEARDDRSRGRIFYNLSLVHLATGDRTSARAEAEKAAQLGCTEAKALLDEPR